MLSRIFIEVSLAKQFPKKSMKNPIAYQKTQYTQFSVNFVIKFQLL